MDVCNRWRFIINQLNGLGVKVLVISSDSDPKYNSSMRILSRLGASTPSSSSMYFNCGMDENKKFSRPFFVQDTVHLATKLRNFLLKSINEAQKFPFGNKNLFISISHLRELMTKFGKDHHNLTEYTLNPTDRQNFESVRRITNEKVTALLKSNVRESEATVKFLELTRDIIDAYMDANLLPLERIQKIWYAVFLIRIWREFIVKCKNYSTKENFLSMNCFSCIELNAHSLVLLISYANEIEKPELFLPTLFNSQICESEFRKIRSFTTVYSTVANCSVKEILERITKIQLQGEIAYSTDFHFPRLDSCKEKLPNQNLPSFSQMIQEIMRIKKKAITDALSFGLLTKTEVASACKCMINPLNVKENSKIRPKCILDDVKKKHLAEVSKTSLPNYTKHFVGKSIGETSPYTRHLLANGKELVLKKTSLCWLLRTDYQKISSDRLLRVRTDTKRIGNKTYKKRTATKRMKKRIKQTTMDMYLFKRV